MPRPVIAGSLLALVLASSAAPAQEFRTENPTRIRTDDDRNTVAAGDVDGDGRLDIVSGTQSGTWVFFNRGDLVFERGSEAVDAHYATAVHATDLDGDGVVDLAVGNSDDSAIDVWRGDGTGSFVLSASVSLEPNRRTAIHIASADVDADGFLDIVTANGPDASVILADGHGGYALRGHFSAGGRTRNVVVADMDEDGHLDLVLSCGVFPATDVFTVRYGDGTGLFPMRVSGAAPQTNGSWAAVADVDADGRLDVVVSWRSPDSLLVFRGTGARSFSPPSEWSAAPLTTRVEARDVTGDGRVDLIGVGQTLSVCEGLAGGAFADPRLFHFEGRDGPFTFGDFDSDGFDDLALALSSSYFIDVYTMDATGSPSAPRLFVEPGTEPPTDLACGDFDGDGRADTALAYTVGPALGGVVIRTSGDGGGLLESARSLVYTSISAIAVHDFVEDGNVDVLVVEPFGQARVLPGDGAGELLAPTHRSFTPFSSFIAAGTDFDSDGHLDLAGSDAARGEVALLRGDGAGRFTPAGRRAVPGTPGDVAAGDFDGDGFPDLVVILEGTSAFGFLRGTGSGELEAPSSFAVLPTPRFLTTADFDGDGRLDVAVQSQFTVEPHRSGATSLFFGDGAGGFSAPVQVGVVDHFASGIAAGDLDADGNQDLVVAQVPRFDVFAGVGAGGFVAAFGGTPRFAPRDPAIADIDGDGRLDVGFRTFVEDGTLMGFHAGALFHLNRTHFLADALRGDVNARVGARENVLLVNGSSGVGVGREVEIGVGESFDVTMAAPTSMPPGKARFVLYEWMERATDSSIVELPLALGRMGAAPPLVPHGRPRFVRCWNNIGREPILGSPTDPSSAAPSVVSSDENGLESPASLFLQGIIYDRNAPNGRAAVTNGIQLEAR